METSKAAVLLMLLVPAANVQAQWADTPERRFEDLRRDKSLDRWPPKPLLDGMYHHLNPKFEEQCPNEYREWMSHYVRRSVQEYLRRDRLRQLDDRVDTLEREIQRRECLVLVLMAMNVAWL